MANQSGDPRVLLQQIAEEVKCALCLEFFQSPRVLECQHTFCTECLYRILYNRYSDRKRIECPLCRQETELSVAGGIDSLPRNVNLTSIAAVLAHWEATDVGFLTSSTAAGQASIQRAPSPALLEFPPQGSGVDYSFQHIPGQCEHSPQFSLHSTLIQTSVQQQRSRSLICAALEVDHDNAMDIFRGWLRSLWFAPSKLQKKLEDEGPFYLQLRYVPFFCFNVSVETSYDATVASTTLAGSHERSPGGVLHEMPRHTHCSGKHNRVYSHLLACAAVDEGLRALADKVTSWDVDGVLSGPAPVPLDECMPWYQAWKAGEVLPTLLRRETQECSRVVLEEEAPARILSLMPKLTFKDIQHTLIYLPMYVSTYRHDSKKFQFVISGQTGEIYGERPYGIGHAGYMFSTVKKWLSGSRVR